MSNDRASGNPSGQGLPAGRGSPTGQVEAARSRFEAAWKAGDRPRIEDFLRRDSEPGPTPRKESGASRELLVALVSVDLEYRWRPTALEPTDAAKAGPQQPDPETPPPLPERPRLEDYVARFPALGPLEELPLDLIVEEYRVRHRWGDHPTHDEYLTRFARPKGPHLPAKRRTAISEMLIRTDGDLASGETIGHTSLVNSATGEAATPPSKPVELRRLGDYELQQRLGHGGMGVVYKARHVLLNQIVALKVLPEKYLDEPQAVSRFRREIQLIGGLDHPNIVQARNAGEHEGVHFLVMEFVDGITLQQLISSREEPLPVGVACELVRQAALGLQHAHLHGLIHRDIKPANLMLSSGGTLKILDLGLARLRADRQSTLQLSEYGPLGVPAETEPGIAIGTVDYMAPEQWEDSSGVDIRADIYSLGCTLFYLLTGEAPYGPPEYGTLREKLKAHATEPVPSIVQLRTDCPKELDRLLQDMLAKEADDRFDTPAEVADAIGQFADPLIGDWDKLVELLPANVLTGQQSDAVSDASTPGSQLDTWRKGPPRSAQRSRSSSRRRAARPWYGRRRTMAAAGALLVILVALSPWWIPLIQRPSSLSPSQQQLRADLGSLPGLKGQWWFDEIPWFVPAVRARLIEAIDRDETEIAGVSIASLAAGARGADVDAFYRQLRTISRELKDRIPDERERTFVADAQLLLFDRDQMSLQGYHEQLREVQEDVDRMRDADTPTLLHFRAVLQHELARYKLAEWSEAHQSYRTALVKYEESDEQSAEILRVLCLADYSQMLFDGREYRDSVVNSQEARRGFDAPALTVATLCLEADASRRLRPVPNMTHAAACLDEARNNTVLPADHPLRAHILQRRAWMEMDSWQFTRAIESFGQSLKIRTNQAEPGGRQTTTFALWSRQGIAMAHHFLGEKEKVVEEFGRLLDDIPDARRAADFQQLQKSQRGPNAFECYADWHLFGAREPDYPAAARYFSDGIQQAEFLHFHEDFRAPYVIRLRYKLMLARALAPGSPADGSNSEPKEALLISQESSKNAEIFAEAQQVALAVVRLQRAVREADPTVLPGDAAEPLLKKITDARPGTQLARNKLGLLLLAIEQVCNSKMLEPDQLKMVARKLNEIAKVTSRGGDAGIRNFLRRYLEAVQRELTRVAEASAGVDLATERELIEEWLR